MTNEHKEFLSGELNKKNEIQIDHIAGCEQCFNYFLFGEGYRCKQYPAKHRIKDSDFKAFLRTLPNGGSVSDDLKAAVKGMSERFNDPDLTDENLHEVTIVPDNEWTKTDIVTEFCRTHQIPMINVDLEKVNVVDLRGVPYLDSRTAE